MFSKKLFLSLLLIALIISVGCVNAVDSSNWKTVKVNDVDFKIPPKYQGGEINTARTNYHYNDLNTFGYYVLMIIFQAVTGAGTISKAKT